MDGEGMFVLEPSTALRLEYLAEGAANIIYKPLPPLSSPSTTPDVYFILSGRRIRPLPMPARLKDGGIDPRLEGKLIRLRKDLSTTVPVKTSWENFKTVISPLFLDNQLLSQNLFKITPQIIKDLNVDLRQHESTGRRAKKRHGCYLAEDESYGTLVTDLSSDIYTPWTTFEFKPKWLTQSPSAPLGSKRCRTCALQAMRHHDHHAAVLPNTSFCPLKLVSGDRSHVESTLDQLSNYPYFTGLRLDVPLWNLLVDWTINSTLLRRLQKLQTELDPVGVLEADVTSQNFRTAMTLRDCSLFVKAGLASRQEVSR